MRGEEKERHIPGRIFITGGSGFVGSAVIDELLRGGWEVRALVHSRPLTAREGRVESVRGDLLETGKLSEAMRGCDGVIHLVGIIRERPAAGVTFQRMHFEGTRSVVDAAKASGVRRFLHMSALGVRPDAQSSYHRTKHQAEQYVQASGLEWTILRPSLIHGPGGEFMEMEAGWARGKSPPFLFMPYFGRGVLGMGGGGRLQPVYVADVARAFVEAIGNPRAVGQAYGVGGPDVLTWPEMHRVCSRAIVGRERLVAPMAVWAAKLMTRIMPPSLLPFNRDQVVMSQEDNTCEMGPFIRDFGWTPRGFEETLRSYAGYYGDEWR